MSSQFKRLTKVLARSFELDEEKILSCFRLATLDDILKVSSLRRQVFGDEITDEDEKYLKWRYLERDGYSSTLWVFEYNKQIIAALGTEPVQLWRNGEIRSALRNMDAIVEPDYNSRGLGAWMTLAIQSQNDCVLVTGGNENSTSMLNKLFTSLVVKKHFKVILHSYHYLHNKLSNDLLVRLISPIVDMSLLLFLKIKWLYITRPGTWNIEFISDINRLLPYIDDQPGLLGKVKVLRSAEYLKWRYADNCCARFHAVAIFDNNVLLGYLIYTCDKAKGADALTEGYIMDWNVFSTPEIHRVLSLLFKISIREIKNRGADEVNLDLNDSDSSHAAKASGFIFRYADPKFFVFSNDLAENDLIFSPDAWYHSLGDSDTI